MNDNKVFWSRIAGFYNNFTRGKDSYNNAYRQLEDKIASEITEKMDVLELAAGPGSVSGKIAGACKHLTITDFSEQMINEARKNVKNKNVVFEIANAIALQYSDASYQAVVIANALHIMPDPEKALYEIKRVVKDDGIIICPTFIREQIENKLKEKILELFGFKTFSRWTSESYKKFLQDNGLVILKSEIITGYNFPMCYVVCKKIS
jgi:phosphatidylethanolamine/phosphatidyl-N-methylethanolamine N-methyltransferase